MNKPKNSLRLIVFCIVAAMMSACLCLGLIACNTPSNSNNSQQNANTESKVTVTLDAGNGACKQANSKVTLNKPFTLPVPTREGYDFVGWSASGIKITDKNGQGLKAWDITKDVTAVAIWTKHIHTYGEWIVIEEATCTTGGTKKKICDVCGETKLADIAITHKYVGDSCEACGKALDFTFMLVYDTYRVTGYTGSETDIVIPSTYNEIAVTHINVDAFMGCDSLTSVIIPDSITGIRVWAFKDCYGLESITIPDSVTIIESLAFTNCINLESITIPDSVISIGGEAFSGTAWYNSQQDGVVYAGKVAYKYKGTMPENTSITLKEGTIGIADCAFQYFNNLTSITIPNSVTSIGNNAFRGCTGLVSITIPDSVTSIASGAFYGCTNLADITIPDSVKRIGNEVFEDCNTFGDCSNLTSITFGGTKAQWLAISKNPNWARQTGNFTIHCKDGDLDEDGNEI